MSTALVLRWAAPPRPLGLRWAGPDGRLAPLAQARPDQPMAAIVGPPGPAGGAALEITLSPAATAHAIAHNLGRRPSVQVRDAGGNVVVADVHHLTPNTLQILTVLPFAGVAVLS